MYRRQDLPVCRKNGGGILTQKIKNLVELLQHVLHDNNAPQSLPAEFSDQKELESLFDELLQIRCFIKAVTVGDLTGKISFKGYTAGVLKTLQANLKHLTWQTQRVAAGDFSQRLDFMGDFSAAFNSMTEQLENSSRIIKEKEIELRAINAELYKDIIERKRVEEVLRRFEIIVTHSRDIILFVRHCDGHILEANAAAIKAYGYSRDHLLTMTIAQLRHAATVNVLPEEMAQADIHGILIETVHFRNDGTSFPVEVSCQGETIGGIRTLISVVRDITERLQAEEAVRLSEERFRKIFEESPIGIAFRDGQRKIIHTNQRYRDFLGYNEVEIKCLAPDKLVHPDDWPLVFELGLRLRNNEISLVHTEHRYVRKDGTIVWADIQITALRDQDGRLIHTIGWVLDITGRKRAEEIRMNLQEQLTQAHKMESVGRLAGGVAHDFNNMLSVIIGNSEMALDQVNTAQPIYHFLQEILKAARRSADLTRQLLAFARKQTIVPQILNLNETVQGMLKMLQRLIGEDLNLSWMPGADLWPVEMDPSQVDQILANLCVNSRDAITGGGSVTIKTGMASFDEASSAIYPVIPGDYVLLSVSDNGCGMSKETKEKLFDPFFTTKEVGKGTGLGLAIIYGIVKQNRGFIDVYSEPGMGSCFNIYLPRYKGMTKPEESAGKADAAIQGHETILLVEDEASILKMATTQLESLGYTVLSASMPGEAIVLARKNAGTINLLITDVVMPEMNGWTLAENLLAIWPALKILFMSGYTTVAAAHNGLLEEGFNFIQKPFSRKELSVKVRETLSPVRSGK